MSSIFPNGTKYEVSTALAAAIAVTAISNASPAVATAVAPPADGSIVIITSGWSSLSETIARTLGAEANSFELEGVDTTDVVEYPAGQGAGQVQRVSTWVEVDQVRSVATSGGDQQFFTYQYVGDKSGRQRQKPTVKSPMVLTFQLDYDPGKPWYAALIAADRAGVPVALKAVLPSGDEMYYLAYPSFNKVPTQAVNENMQNTATFSLITDPVRYKGAA